MLKELNPNKAKELENRMKKDLLDPSSLFPIRIPSYYIGLLMINAFILNGVYDYETNKRPFINKILDKVNLVNIDTGATYRCVALKVLRNKIDITDTKKIIKTTF